MKSTAQAQSLNVQTAQSSNTSPSTGLILALLVTLLASAGWVFTKLGLTEIESSAFIAWRFFLAALVLTPFCLKEIVNYSVKQWREVLIIGCALGLGINIWVEGMYRTKSIGEAAFIVSLTVVLIPLLGLFWKQRISASLWVCLSLAVFGLFLLTGANVAHIESSQIILLVSAVFFALHVVCASRYAKTVSSLSSTCVQLWVAALIGAVMSARHGTLLMFQTTEISNFVWLMLICSAWIATSLRFAVQNKAATMISANEMGMVFAMGPIWTAALGWLILDERFTLLQFVGALFIFLSQLAYRFSQNMQKKKEQ